VLLTVTFSLFGSALIHGLGKNAASLEPSHIMPAMKLTWIAFFFSPSAEGTGKISIALLVMRLTTNKHCKRFFVVFIVLHIAIAIGMSISMLITCRPIQMLWDPRITGYCSIKKDVMGYIQGGK